MDVAYTRKTSDNNTVEIWEDGLVTSRLGYKIPGIGNKKLPNGTLATFAEEVMLFSMDELWALHEAMRRLGRGARAALPADVRKLALSILSQKVASFTERFRAVIAAAGDVDATLEPNTDPKLLVANIPRDADLAKDLFGLQNYMIKHNIKVSPVFLVVTAEGHTTTLNRYGAKGYWVECALSVTDGDEEISQCADFMKDSLISRIEQDFHIKVD